MKFDVAEFIDQLHEETQNTFEKSEIQEILDIGDSFDRDSPISTGKRLIVNKVSFYGKKDVVDGQDYSGLDIDFSLEFQKGVFLLIADNLKGKSSVFKIVKFALTGKADSLKFNVKKWIHYAFVNFSINEKNYTSFLDLSKPRIKAKLLHGVYDSVEQVGNSVDPVIFEAASIEAYETLISEFFFQQFSYFSLKWTQKASQKDKNELLEAGASWATYFKSIFLESRDSGSLFYGDQAKKIFQMLLGLELTYPINRMTVKKEMLVFGKSKEKNQLLPSRKIGDDWVSMSSRITEISNELGQIDKRATENVNLTGIYSEYNSLIKKINETNGKKANAERLKRDLNSRLRKVKDLKENNLEDIKRLTREMDKNQKKIIDLNEYLEIGVLFSNLDIKHCPSCNHDVSPQKKTLKNGKHTCSLCNETVENEIHDIEPFKEKVKNLEVTNLNLEKDISIHLLKKTTLDDEYKEVYGKLISIQDDSEEPTLDTLVDRLQQLEKVINSEKNKIPISTSKKDMLIAEKAVLEFKLQQISDREKHLVEDYDNKIHLLNIAIEKLSKKRLELGAKVIDKLSEILRKEIANFGLSSISKVEISDNFDILFLQDNELVKFDSIAEGEKLRVKLAFYLSLIQLDIEANYGRHTRLLIIDSPANEEADDKYLESFTSIIRNIEERYGDQLQILIGTAERKLSGIVKKQKEFERGEYVF